MRTYLIFPALALLTACASAERKPEPAVPVGNAPAASQSSAPRVTDDQKLYGPGTGATLVPQDRALAVVDRFKEAYGKLGNPRLLLYVNRELVDADSGMKLTRRTERTEAERQSVKSDFETPAPSGTPQTQVNVAVGGGDAGNGGLPPGKGSGESSSEKVQAENSYELREGGKLSLTDKQTVRDVERLFGRPLRLAGAALADQKVAASLLPDKAFDQFSAGGASDQARKDREALQQVADVAIEILISSRPMTVKEVSGDRVVQVPDIQATAIRLKDAAVLGQASASDVLGKDRQAAPLVRNFDVRDIAEATALALMEDLAASAR